MKPRTVVDEVTSIRHELLELERGDTDLPVVLRSVRRRLSAIARKARRRRRS